VLAGDLDHDAEAFANVRYTIRAGKIIYSAQLPPQSQRARR
jgi:hypothetical protein